MVASYTTVVSTITADEAGGCWEIRGLSRFQRNMGKEYWSGSLLEVGGFRYQLVLILGGEDPESRRKVSLHVDQMSDGRTMGQHTVRICNQKHGSNAIKVLRGEPGVWDGSTCWGWNNFMELERLEDPKAGFVVDDTLILELRMQVWPEDAVQTQGACAALTSSSRSAPAAPCYLGGELAPSLGSDLGRFLASGRAADLLVRGVGLGALGGSGDSCDQEEPLHAHRLVLASRSHVFERMLLGSSMKESARGAELHLHGANRQLALWFLQYLYSDEVALEAWEDQEALCHLLMLAHKYQVPSLLAKCLNRVVQQLTEENSAERLMMVDLLDVPELKAAVLDYICSGRERLARVQATEGFARLAETRPRLLTDLLAAVVHPATKRVRYECGQRDKVLHGKATGFGDGGSPGSPFRLVDRLT